MYDYVIVGGGLSGLLMGAKLSAETDNVLILEAGDSFGGVNRPVETPTGPLDNGFRFLPDTKNSRKALGFVAELIGQEIEANSVEHFPVTFEGGSLKEFVGFGNNPPEFYDELAYFINPKHLELGTPVYSWPQLLLEKYHGDFLPRSYVTKFVVSDDNVTQVIVNGSKTISGHNFIYCGPLKSLAPLLPDEVMNPRAKNKLSKSLYWTGVGLEITHSSVITDSKAVHVLNGTTQDEIGPCVGVFHPAQIGEDLALQTSQWLTFVDEETSEDSEVVGIALKKIKRQIKRAYPTALEGIKRERIVVTPACAGFIELKRNANQSLSGAKNLWIASGQVHNERNLVGAILQVQYVCSALGFGVSLPDETSHSIEDFVETEVSESNLEAHQPINS